MSKTSSETGIFVRTHRRDFGPFTEQELTRAISGGRVPLSAWVYHEKKWRLLAEIEELREKHPEFEPMPAKPPKVTDETTGDVTSLPMRRAEIAAAAGAVGTISSEPVWFVIREKTKYGPYSAAELIGQLQQKELDRTAFVWRPGFATWQKLSQVPEFSRENMQRLVEQNANLDIIVKRRHARAPFEVEVIAHDNTRAIEGKTMMIGEGGCFLSVARPTHARGARLRLHFSEGETHAFNVVAEVVAIVRNGSPGYCLKFVAISDSDRKSIAKLVAERKKEK